MKCFIKTLILVLLNLNFLSVNSYEYTNQAKWYDDYKQCGLAKQSPIELSSNESDITKLLPNIYLPNYEMMFFKPVTVENNGHTANIILPKYCENCPAELIPLLDQLSPHMNGGPFNAFNYIAESLHFHWGSKDAHGSEHVIDGQRHTMEMHILHRNSKYKTVEEARENEDGLAVLAILYQVNTLSLENIGINSIIETLENIKQFNTTTEIHSFFSLASLIGDLKRDEFFTYSGSLTTPPCSQSVTWVVFTDIVPISHQQMTRFHQLRDDHGASLENNYRSLQAKGGRHVTLRKPQERPNGSIAYNPLFRNIFDLLK